MAVKVSKKDKKILIDTFVDICSLGYFIEPCHSFGNPLQEMEEWYRYYKPKEHAMKCTYQFSVFACRSIEFCRIGFLKKIPKNNKKVDTVISFLYTDFVKYVHRNMTKTDEGMKTLYINTLSETAELAKSYHAKNDFKNMMLAYSSLVSTINAAYCVEHALSLQKKLRSI